MCQSCPAAYNVDRLAEIVDAIVPSGCIMVGDRQRDAPGRKGAGSRREECVMMNGKGVAPTEAPCVPCRAYL
jgi:hypothetical protein